MPVYLKHKFNDFATNSENKDSRDIGKEIMEFRRSCLPGNKSMKDENVDLLADSYNILNRLKNYSTQLLNVNSVSDIKCR
jgi:hypothetical protein